MVFKKNDDKKTKVKVKIKGEKLAPKSEDAKAKAEQDYASHPKFAKFKGENK